MVKLGPRLVKVVHYWIVAVCSSGGGVAWQAAWKLSCKLGCIVSDGWSQSGAALMMFCGEGTTFPISSGGTTIGIIRVILRIRSCACQ